MPEPSAARSPMTQKTTQIRGKQIEWERMRHTTGTIAQALPYPPPKNPYHLITASTRFCTVAMAYRKQEW